MERQSLVAVFETLNDSGVPYVVVGGLAVLAHGYVRATNDVDLVLDLDDERLEAALQALSGLGFRPVVPVEITAFADETARRSWVEQKGARVFGLFSEVHPTLRIDLLIERPFDLTTVLARSRSEEVAPGVAVPFLGLADLIEMKLAAGRPQDLADVAKLRLLAGRRDED